MIQPKTDSEEIGMEEIHDDVSKPLTSTETETVPSVHLPNATSLFRIVDGNEAHPNPELKDDHRLEDEKSSIGFIDNGLPNPKLVSYSNEMIGSRDLFSQPVQMTPDVNIYQHKKTLAQGMMDLALLSANANQMRYVLQTDGQHPFFYPSLTMIAMSLFLQIAVGIGLIWNSRYNVKEHEDMCKANKANNWTVIGIFLVTTLNVFISSFGVVDQVNTTTALAVSSQPSP